MLLRIILIAVLSPTLFSHAQQAQEGIASVIQDSFNGQETRYGVRYDKKELTCAHNIHPFGALLKVTNLENMRSVTVRIIDEGPFTKGRIIELSRRAAEIIGMKPELETLVRVELVRTPNTTAKAGTVIPETPATTPKINPQNTNEPVKSLQQAAVPIAAKLPSEKNQASPARSKQEGNSLFQIVRRSADNQTWGVQIGSVSNAEYVFGEIERLQAKNFDNILLSLEKGDAGQTLYKLILGPFYSETQARQYQTNLSSHHKINGFVVNLYRSGN
jgi:rare lipoprotein A